MKIKTRELTLCAVLAALALALSYMESFFPLALIVPLPGVKLGLANIVTLYALYAIGFPSALASLGSFFLMARRPPRSTRFPCAALFRSITAIR